MPAMIQKCPGCGRNSILAKATGKCVHCKAGKPAPVVTIVGVPPVVVTPVHLSPSSRPSKPKPTRAARVHGGRIVR